MSLDNITWPGETEAEQMETRNRIEGETKAIRSILYFDMVRLFGNIPLLTEPTDENVPN
jgi:hypothetical protein